MSGGRLKAEAARRLVGGLGNTWTIDAVGREHPGDRRDRALPLIFALWHRHLLPLIWYHRGDSTALIVSGHQDGGYLAAAARRWGYKTIRGSSTRGGTGAFRAAVRELREGGEIAVTPDGPRGPALVAKPGAAEAARVTGACIIPVAASARRYWRIGSWDPLVIPKPFARVRVTYGPPIWIPRHFDRARATQALQDGLDRLGGAW